MKEILKTYDTFPKLLVRNAETLGDRKVAMREKEFGIWQEFTWKEYHEHVKYFSLGMVSLGLQAGDKVAIIGDNRPEWVWGEVAAQAAGAVPLGLYQDSTLKEVSYIIDHSDASFVLAEDQEQVDKILDMKEQLPKVRYIIYSDPRGMRGYKQPFLLDFKEVENFGRELEQRDPGLFAKNVAAAKYEDLAFICYTSGTTGFPKGAMLSYRNFLSMAANLMEVDNKFEKDEFVSFLPLAWIGEQMMCLSSALLTGFTVNFPEKPETVQENIREIGPTIMFSPPRIWENMTSTVQVKVMDASALKRRLYNWALPVGYAYSDAVFRKEAIPPLLRLKQKLAYALVFRALKDRLGLLRIRSASTGGAALGPDVFKFFNAMGVNLKQIYGQTEISGISCIHREGDINFDSVGKPIPETEIRLSDSGEILSRSPSVFIGYHKNPEETEKTLNDGWLHSGDAGYFTEDGHLIVIDRVKDVMHLNDATRFSPQFIENKLKFSPYIKECVCLGNQRDFIASMICIDYPNVGKWAESRRLSYTTYTDLAAKPEVLELLAKEVEKVNATLPETTRVKKFVPLYKELDADDDELTRTRKVRRAFVGERYKHVIEGIYAGEDAIPIDATIKYQDGKTSRIRTTLTVRNL
ncbi:AMP-binding protein [Candidatus Deferrimicrobium sp.]|uniref:AMP-binding protein n=1 Tax=Candidatus Deferrimicrobium sp. TaxID=3060586 RepID=UPI00271FA7C6|nr:AMP-binding protein [Candidatus Deferrimicrobium sp.]MDO8738237.1 AMP-binding protein [Candidatus Deferrimicrobium sp.]